MARRQYWAIGGLLLTASAFATTGARANSAVCAETVNDYTFVCGGSHSCDIATCNDEGYGFYNTLTSGPNFSPGFRLWDFSVTDRNFHDPNVSGGNPYDNDNANFDRSDLAASYVCLHGTCDHTTTTPCFTSSSCPVGQYCSGFPPSVWTPACIRNTPRRMVTSNSIRSHNNNVFYGGGFVKWGESPYAGGWAGAGTNGGTNLVVMVNSCGLTMPWWSQIYPAFAGMQILAGIMPTATSLANFSDTRSWGPRGQTLAGLANANMNARVQDSWFATMDTTPQGEGLSCPDQSGSYTYGGGHGINGCGAHYVSSVATTWQSAWLKTLESWNNIKSESYDSTGNTYQWYAYHCNYDCAMYPFTR